MDAVNHRGFTALHTAAVQGNAEVAAILLNAGASPPVCMRWDGLAGRGGEKTRMLVAAL